MFGSSTGAGSGLRISICQKPNPTAGKKQRNAVHMWASESTLLRSTIHPFVRPQGLELISGHHYDAGCHRVMTETAKFVTGHLVRSRALKPCAYVCDIAGDNHGIGVRALYEKAMGHISAGKAKANGRRGRHDRALRNKNILLGNYANRD